MTAIKNLAASVHARLQNQAKQTAQPFQQMLQYFAMERFLYRLSQSPHRARFTLKGALMLHVWNAPQARATKDIDFLGRTNNSLENLTAVVRELCSIAVEPDGMIFDPDTVQATRIKEDADYEGVRVRFIGHLGKARVAMQIDVGFGDVVTPDAQSIVYPTLLDFPYAELLGYPRETVVAEKFHAMVYLGTTNSRMKDFYDVWLLASEFPFDGAVLTDAINATFAHRSTAIDPTPIAFTTAFFDQPSTSAQWRAFRTRLQPARCPETLVEAVDTLRAILSPVARACADRSVFNRHWTPGGPWGKPIAR